MKLAMESGVQYPQVSETTRLHWNIEHYPADNIVHVKTSGELRQSCLQLLNLDVMNSCRVYKSTRILVDHRDTKSTMSLLDIYEGPRQLGEMGLPRASDVAIVYPQARNASYRFVETVFTNRGYALRTFTDIDAAEAWLKQSKS